MIRLLTGIITAPVRLPANGLVWLASKLSEKANDEVNNPAVLRSLLAEAEEMLLNGDMTEAEYDEIEDNLLERLKIAAAV